MTDSANLILTSPQPWFGNQRMGAFVVSVDGAKAGTLMPQGSIEVSCSAGHHVMRARQGWYRSTSLDLDLHPGTETRVSVEVTRQGSLIRRFFVLMFLPWRAIQLTVDRA